MTPELDKAVAALVRSVADSWVFIVVLMLLLRFWVAMIIGRRIK